MKNIKLLSLVFVLISISCFGVTCFCSQDSCNDDYQKVDSSFNSVECLLSEPIEQLEHIEESEIPVYYQISEEERDLLARLCFLEASICSEECQRAVVSVIFNRLESGRWKKDVNGDGQVTIYDIVYYPNAFSPAPVIYKYEADDEAFEAVDYVVQNGPTIPEYVRYFRIDYDFNWDNYSNYDVMDTVYFGYLNNWEEGAW